MCRGVTELVRVRSSESDLFIDACIAPLVRALQREGIDTVASCCGHGEMMGGIDLADGRTLLITDWLTGNSPWHLVKRAFLDALYWSVKRLYCKVTEWPRMNVEAMELERKVAQ